MNDIIDMDQGVEAACALAASHQRDSALATTTAITPMQIISQAMQAGTKAEDLRVLWEFQKEWQALEAKKEFTAALLQFQSENIVIDKNASVSHNGVFKYKHATLDHINFVLTPILSKFGFSKRWKTEPMGDKIRITCILTHAAGHSEDSTMESGPDLSGGKNHIQGMSSAKSYLMRYTFLDVTGISTGLPDDDAKDIFDDAATAHHLQAMRASKSKSELLAAWLAASSAAAGDKKAYRMLEAARDEQSAVISMFGVKTAPAHDPQVQQVSDVAARLVKAFRRATDIDVLQADAALLDTLPEADQEYARSVYIERLEALDVKNAMSYELREKEKTK